MIIGEIDFPAELLSAQSSGNLLVFAGAGVSMGPPANLPSFEGLVRKIEHRSGSRWKKEISFDHYLGQLADRGVAVHQLAKQEIDKPESSHTPLHLDLTRLFKSCSEIRIVTTNFDDHFSTASETVHGGRPSIYAAPALPYGDNFKGIVHVHGHIQTSSSRLVLTDEDFGRAYSTEGWARRFLVDAFRRYTVLFVGYSHEDPPLIYLARGMPTDRKPAYALSSEDEKTDWKHLGIEAVTFSNDPQKKPFHALGVSVSAWSTLIHTRPLDHKRKIYKLLSAESGDLTPQEDSYLQYAFRRYEFIPFFVQAGLKSSWLLWSEERGLLAPAFTQAPLDQHGHDYAKRVAWWFSRNAVLNCDAAISVFMRAGHKMHVHLWNAIGQALHSGREDVSPRVRRVWYVQLTHYWTKECVTNYFEYALDSLAKAGDFECVLLLLRFLLTPEIRHKSAVQFEDSDPPIWPDVVLRCGEQTWIQELFNHHGDEIYRRFSESLMDMTGDYLRIATSMYGFHYDTDDYYDMVSAQRSAIEPHDQDDSPKDLNPLIDIARDSLKSVQVTNPALYTSTVNRWIQEKAFILKRLALHAVRTDPNIPADGKLCFLKTHDALAHTQFHHEAFLLIRESFISASSEAQHDVLEYIRSVTLRDIKTHIDMEERIFWHHEYNLLAGIMDTGIRHRGLSQRFAALSKKYPDWKPTDHPAFLSYHYPVESGWPSPYSAAQLRDMPVDRLIKLVGTYKGEIGFRKPTREGLLYKFQVAVRDDPAWGLEVGSKALAQPNVCVDLIDEVITALQQIDPVPWDKAVRFIPSIPFKHLPKRDASFLLRKMKWHEFMALSDFVEIERLAFRILTHAVTQNNHPAIPSNWYSMAINYESGLALEILIMAQMARQRISGKASICLTPRFRRAFEQIMSSKNTSAYAVRTKLCSHLHQIFWLDPVWTRDKVFPLLDWRLYPDAAFPAWVGLLSGGKWNPKFAQRLYKLLRDTIPHLEKFDEPCRKGFSSFIVSLCIHTKSKKIRDQLVPAYLQACSDKERYTLLRTIGENLSPKSTEKKERFWSDWVLDHLQDRFHGKPVPLDAEEVGIICTLSLKAGKHFPDVVNMICSSDLPCKSSSHVLVNLERNDLPKIYPESTAHLLLFMVSQKSTRERFLYGKWLHPIIETIAKDERTHHTLQNLIDALAVCGAVDDAEVIDKLLESYE